MNWCSPAKPAYTTGRIVFNSDDGRIWDYTHYFKIIKRAITKGNQFNPLHSGIFCPAVNTGYTESGRHETAGLPVMSWDMLKEISKQGGEILSHGKYHLFLAGNKISQAVSIGATRIYYNNDEGRPRENMKFFITDGVNRDDFTVTSYLHSTTKYMDIEPPLTHNYTTSATVNLHEDSMAEQLGGIISDLEEHGILCKHHINAWYYHSALSLSYLKQYFESVVTNSETNGYTITTEPQSTDIYGIIRQPDLRFYTIEQLDALLDDVQSKDSVAFIQMHGAFDKTVFDNIEYLIAQALNKGVRIVTHSEAIEFIKSKYLLMEFTEVESGIWEVEGESTQNGTPSPTNPIPVLSNYPKGIYKTNIPTLPYIRLNDDLRGIEGYRDKIVYDVSERGYTLTKKIKQYILNGTESFVDNKWGNAEMTAFLLAQNTNCIINNSIANMLCSHLKAYPYNTLRDNPVVGICPQAYYLGFAGQFDNATLGILPTDTETVKINKLKSWLTLQEKFEVILPYITPLNQEL